MAGIDTGRVDVLTVQPASVGAQVGAKVSPGKYIGSTAKAIDGINTEIRKSVLEIDLLLNI